MNAITSFLDIGGSMKTLYQLRFYDERKETIAKINTYSTRRQIDKIFFACAFGLTHSSVCCIDLFRIARDSSLIPLNSCRLFGGLQYVYAELPKD